MNVRRNELQAVWDAVVSGETVQAATTRLGIAAKSVKSLDATIFLTNLALPGVGSGELYSNPAAFAEILEYAEDSTFTGAGAIIISALTVSRRRDALAYIEAVYARSAPHPDALTRAMFKRIKRLRRLLSAAIGVAVRRIIVPGADGAGTPESVALAKTVESAMVDNFWRSTVRDDEIVRRLAVWGVHTASTADMSAMDTLLLDYLEAEGQSLDDILTRSTRTKSAARTRRRLAARLGARYDSRFEAYHTECEDLAHDMGHLILT